jgi:O6-methylguanine-DNA--protein-cysteine methyltransferase
LVLGVLAACAKPAATNPPAAVGGSGIVGYVRMADLVKHHPLYSELTGYDESIEALNLQSVVPDVAKPNAEIAKAEAALQSELNAAAERTRRLLAQKSAAYQAREQQAIALALRAPAGHAPSAAQIAQQINATAQQQAVGVAAQANRDFDSYRKTLVAQDTGELRAAQKTLADRAQRRFRAKADELQAKESALSLAGANRDASTRLSLKTRLSSLALDDAQRDDVRNALAALDRSESDTLAAMKNRDAQTLAALAAQLRSGVQHDLKAKADEIHHRSLAELDSRETDIRKQFAPGVPQVVAISRGSRVDAAKLSPQLKSTLKTLHDNYQKQFNGDAKSTIADFQRTRDDLRRRYEQLRGIDSAAQSGASAQIVALTRKRADLYGQMVAQIGREVRLLAQARGISVVVTDPVANPGGVDLTADAMKDIESLHE